MLKNIYADPYELLTFTNRCFLLLIVIIGLFISTENSAEEYEWPPNVVEKFNTDKVTREQVRDKHPKLFEAISESMFRHDPIGINFGSNIDEYEAEVGTVIPRLSEARDAEDAITIVHEEFVKWFGSSSAGDRSRYIELGREVWNLWLLRTSGLTP